MRKKSEQCIKIYDDNKGYIYWFLSKKCSWLPEEAIYEVILNVCRILSCNADEVCNLSSELSQRNWLIKTAYDQAVKYIKKEK